MKQKLSILYSWFIRAFTFLLPDIPAVMRFRGFLYSLMMKKCGKNFQVTSTVVLNPLTGVSVGDNVYIAYNTVILGTDIRIGDNVLIGPNCVFASDNHTFHNDSFRFGKSQIQTITIREGSWVGGNCSILGGAILPPRSVLGAGSVLNKKFEDADYLYGGVPASPIKKLRSAYTKTIITTIT